MEEQKLSFKNFQNNVVEIKNSVHNNLTLDRTKKIKFEDKDYLYLLKNRGENPNRKI